MQARRSRRVISPSLSLAREVAQRWGMDLDSITIVPTGIDPPQVSGSPIPESLAQTRYMLYFGRLEIRKGVDTLIDALVIAIGAATLSWQLLLAPIASAAGAALDQTLTGRDPGINGLEGT